MYLSWSCNLRKHLYLQAADYIYNSSLNQRGKKEYSPIYHTTLNYDFILCEHIADCGRASIWCSVSIVLYGGLSRGASISTKRTWKKEDAISICYEHNCEYGITLRRDCVSFHRFRKKAKKECDNIVPHPRPPKPLSQDILLSTFMQFYVLDI